MPILEISLNPPKITLEARDLELTPKWVYALCWLAVRVVDHNPVCAPTDLAQIPYWLKPKTPSTITSIIRFYRQYPYLLEPANGAISKAFRLHSRLEPVFSDSLEVVRASLQPKRQSLLELPAMNTKTSALIAIGIFQIERGNFEQATQTLQQGLASKPNQDQELEILLWFARMQEFQSQYDLAFQTLTELKTEIALLERSKKVLVNPARKGMLYIQTARLHLRLDQISEALKNYHQAKSYLRPTDHREHGALENGLGRVAQARDDLEAAFKHYERAASSYSSGNLIWGFQAALNDMAVVFRLRAQKCERSQPERARGHYQTALVYLELSEGLCSAAQLGGDSAVLEINLAHTHRKLGNPEQAQIWLERAQKLARDAGNDHDLAFALLEQGDFHQAFGDTRNAKQSFFAALEIFEKLGNLEQQKMIEKRLLDLGK
jgi:tetratricopeptide (TPR) repeat protein